MYFQCFLQRWSGCYYVGIESKGIDIDIDGAFDWMVYAMKKPKDTRFFKFVNLNPKGLKTNDCVIRAIANGLDVEYATVFKDLCVLAEKMSRMPNDKMVYTKYLESKGWKKYGQPRKSDNTKYLGKEWCDGNDDTIIAHIGGHHLSCYKAGVWQDLWDCTSKCIGNYWKRGD